MIWYSEPQFREKIEDRHVIGTIRSTRCKRILFNAEKKVCSNCQEILKEQSFVKRVQRANDCHGNALPNTSSMSKQTVNNRCLDKRESLQKLRKYRKLCNNLRFRVNDLCKIIARNKATKMKLSGKLGEHSKRGDVSAIICNLNEAYYKGLLGGRFKLLKFARPPAQSPRTSSLEPCIKAFS